MDNRIERIKQSVYKVALCSTIIFILSLIFISIFITLIVTSSMSKMWWLWLGLAILFTVISLFTFLAFVCGFAFLNANKEWKELDKVRKKSTLDWGLFYFVYSNRIDRIYESEHKEK